MRCRFDDLTDLLKIKQETQSMANALRYFNFIFSGRISCRFSIDRV